jgi:protein gp37
MAKRLAGRYGYPKDEPFKVTFHQDKLHNPMKWKKPRKIFVCSMGDIFHSKVPHIDHQDVFAVMHRFQQHIYMLLTKRPKNINTEEIQSGVYASVWQKNIWLGVTTENQKRADERIPTLLQIPAAVRFVSIEPMLGPVDLIYRPQGYMAGWRNYLNGQWEKLGSGIMTTTKLDWVIAGPETGPGARECKPEWIEDLYEQCKAAGVPFFDKRKENWIAREFPEGVGNVKC